MNNTTRQSVRAMLLPLLSGHHVATTAARRAARLKGQVEGVKVVQSVVQELKKGKL